MNWEDFGKINLLIVEDDPFNMELATTMFQNIPTITIFCATNGIEALQDLQRYDIDIIILDIHMPVMDGFDTIKSTRKQFKYNLIPIIVVTTEEREMEKSYELGADDFVSKPYKPIELKSRVFTHLKKSKYRDKFYNLTKNMKKEIEIKNKQLLETMNSLESVQKKLFLRMGKIIDYKKSFGNNKRVGYIAKNFALKLGLGDEDSNNIFYACMVRNLGLLALPNEIANQEDILKDKDKLILKQFILYSQELVKDITQTRFLKIVNSVLMEYKENYNGSGYPNQLKGDDISRYAVIVAISETFDALLSTRKYRYKKKFTSEETKRILKAESGKRFKPNILNLFLQNFDEFVIVREKMVKKQD